MSIKLPFLIALFLSIPFVSSAQNSLYQTSGEVKTEWAGKSQSELLKTPVDIDRRVLHEIRSGDIEEFQIETPDGELYTVSVKRVIDHIKGNWSVTGDINKDWRNHFILSYSDGSIYVEFKNHDNGTLHRINFSSDQNRHHLHKLNPDERDELSCGLDDHDHLTVENGLQKNYYPSPDQTDETTVIDVMIVYTPAAANWAMLNQGGIDNIISQSMAVAQNTVDNSELNMEFRLVHSAQVNYNESGDSFTDLYRLTTSPTYLPRGSEYSGYMDEVHEWRDEFNADLVAIFTLADDVGGLGWLLRSENGDSRLGFSLTRVQQAAGTTHVHEMGHNMGKAHSRNQNRSAAGIDGGLFEYSTGWRWTGQNGAGYASVMTYNEGDQSVQIFSNPDVFVQGVPTGSYVGDFAPADNSRSMRNIKQVVSSYRFERNVPVVSTDSVFNITAGRAAGLISLIDENESDVSEAGICWSTTQNPGRNDDCYSVNNPQVGEISVNLENLSGNRTYHARAFAENSDGTGFGESVEFRTEDISANQSRVVASRNRVLATGLQHSSIEVTVLNSSGNPVEDALVYLNQTGGESDIYPDTVRTDENGRADFSVTGENEAEIEYQPVAEDLPINQTTTVEFLYSDEIVKLGNNFPNPFSSNTFIPIVVEEPGRVTIEIFNSLGSKVKTLLDEQKGIGYYEIPFQSGSLASGLYFYRYTTDRVMENEKMILVR
ncbi:MAG: M12 family metallo-peptidase [Balneolaceae bacterium]|nr:M12 family metallo-peptidase [Balneolaceae bacterium]